MSGKSRLVSYSGLLSTRINACAFVNYFDHLGYGNSNYALGQN